MGNIEHSSFLKNVLLEQCKGVHRVDLGESFQTHIYLQNFVSIQPRREQVHAAVRDATVDGERLLLVAQVEQELGPQLPEGPQLLLHLSDPLHSYHQQRKLKHTWARNKKSFSNKKGNIP